VARFGKAARDIARSDEAWHGPSLGVIPDDVPGVARRDAIKRGAGLAKPRVIQRGLAQSIPMRRGMGRCDVARCGAIRYSMGRYSVA